MSDEKLCFAKKDINEQTAYLKDVFQLMRFEHQGTDALRDRDGRKPMPRRKETSWEEWEASLESVLQEKRLRTMKRKADFESKLKESPERYPFGLLCRKARLNAFERFAVAATAAVAMFNRHDFHSFDVRTLASFYHRSHIKRLDAELYFHGDCKLVRLGLVEIESDRRGNQVFEKEVRIGRGAYLALLGKDPEGLESEENHTQFPTHRLRGKSPGQLVSPLASLTNVVLAPEARRVIDMALAQASNQQRIFEDWGLGEQVAIGRSTTILLAGPPGTGKTLTAGAFARELGKKMLLVKGADIVSPWHGEDEIHAAQVFRQAADSDAVLVFDEADSFFYARHGVRSSTDEASNRTVNVFLGCLEEHEFPVILTTNRADALDPALERRISLKVVLNPPSAAERAKIWSLHLPGKMPLSADVDVQALADKYPLTGGQIKNVVVAAARAAILGESTGRRRAQVTMDVLEQACREELKGSEVFGTVERKFGFGSCEDA